MGIKFTCPQGHKLHVKSFLAGKRGICPHCGVKFRIPMESGGAAEPIVRSNNADPAMAAGVTSGYASGNAQMAGSPGVAAASVGDPGTLQQAPSPDAAAAGPMIAASPGTPAAFSLAGSAAADPLAEHPHALWYVRPRSGGQFGPAAAEIMRQWLAEGRVAGDSLVWREGWADWRQASTVFSQLAASPALAAVPAALSVPMGSPSVAPGMGAVSIAAAEPARTRAVVPRRKSNELTLLLVFLLVIVAIVLAVVFVIVVQRQKTTSQGSAAHLRSAAGPYVVLAEPNAHGAQCFQASYAPRAAY